jgi:hypothetical protein
MFSASRSTSFIVAAAVAVGLLASGLWTHRDQTPVDRGPASAPKKALPPYDCLARSLRLALQERKLEQPGLATLELMGAIGQQPVEKFLGKPKFELYAHEGNQFQKRVYSDKALGDLQKEARNYLGQVLDSQKFLPVDELAEDPKSAKKVAELIEMTREKLKKDSAWANRETRLVLDILDPTKADIASVARALVEREIKGARKVVEISRENLLALATSVLLKAKDHSVKVASRVGHHMVYDYIPDAFKKAARWPAVVAIGLTALYYLPDEWKDKAGQAFSIREPVAIREGRTHWIKVRSEALPLKDRLRSISLGIPKKKTEAHPWTAVSNDYLEFGAEFRRIFPEYRLFSPEKSLIEIGSDTAKSFQKDYDSTLRQMKELTESRDTTAEKLQNTRARYANAAATAFLDLVLFDTRPHSETIDRVRAIRDDASKLLGEEDGLLITSLEAVAPVLQEHWVSRLNQLIKMAEAE